MARITVDEISRKEFSFANKGYNQKEVDDFLDDICDEMERMENEIKDLRQKTTAVIPPVQKTAGAVTTEDAEAIRVKAETEANERLNGLSDERKTLEAEVAALKKAATGRTKLFLFTPPGRMATVRAAIRLVLHMMDPMALP